MSAGIRVYGLFEIIGQEAICIASIGFVFVVREFLSSRRLIRSYSAQIESWLRDGNATLVTNERRRRAVILGSLLKFLTFGSRPLFPPHS